MVRAFVRGWLPLAEVHAALARHRPGQPAPPAGAGRFGIGWR